MAEAGTRGLGLGRIRVVEKMRFECGVKKLGEMYGESGDDGRDMLTWVDEKSAMENDSDEAGS